MGIWLQVETLTASFTVGSASYANNSPLVLVDTDGHDLKVAKELQGTVNTLRQQSPAFDSALHAYEGANSPNLTITFGATPNDPSGVPSIGNTDLPLVASPAIISDPKTPSDDGTVYSTPKDSTTTITISDSIKGDAKAVSNVTKHEVGHAVDGRTNTNQYGHDSQKTKETNGKTPHDDRPEEKRANAFKDVVTKEQKQYQKDHKQ